MGAVKVSVSLGEEELAWAQKRAKRLKTSLSAVLTEAVRQQKQMEARREVLAYLHEQVLPGTSEELAEIAREWTE